MQYDMIRTQLTQGAMGSQMISEWQVSQDSIADHRNYSIYFK